MKRTIRKVKKPDNSSKLVCLSTTNSNGLASSVSSSRCAYVAECILVVYDVDSGAQSHLMVSHRMPRPLSCVAVSKDGRFIATRESGTQLAVLVWDVETLALVSELKGHLFGVGCIAFSPDGRHLVSVGGYIHLWEWRIGMLVTKLKASASCSAISSVSFSLDVKFVITAGKKHLMFWTVRSSPKTRISKGNVSMTMHGEAVNLGLQKGRSFISVTSSLRTDKTTMCGQAGEFFPLYALTDAASAKEKVKQWKKEGNRSVDLDSNGEVALKGFEQISPKYNSQVRTSLKGMKRKFFMMDPLDKHLETMRSSISNVANAIREGNQAIREINAITEKCIYILEKGRPPVYSEPELQLDACLFLIKDASKVQAFFVVPSERCYELLLKMMYPSNEL